MPPAPTKNVSAHDGPVVDTVGEYTIVACRACGYRHVAPLPSEAEIAAWYRERHYVDGVRDRIDYYERDRDWWRLAHGDVFSEVGRHQEGDGRRLIDVGCGTGIFLEVGRERGWDVVGFEPSQTAAEHCRKKGLRIIESLFSLDELAKIDLEKSDLVNLRNVLEHVTDPGALLACAHEVLRPGGLVIASVPNDYNPLQQTVREVAALRPWWLAPPHHLNYFDFDSLERLVERCGFQPVGRFCTFPLDMFLLMGDIYVDDSELGRSCHLKRVRLETSLEAAGRAETRRALYRSLAAAGLGREAVVIARRPN